MPLQVHARRCHPLRSNAWRRRYRQALPATSTTSARRGRYSLQEHRGRRRSRSSNHLRASPSTSRPTKNSCCWMRLRPGPSHPSAEGEEHKTQFEERTEHAQIVGRGLRGATASTRRSATTSCRTLMHFEFLGDPARSPRRRRCSASRWRPSPKHLSSLENLRPGQSWPGQSGAWRRPAFRASHERTRVHDQRHRPRRRWHACRTPFYQPDSVVATPRWTTKPPPRRTTASYPSRASKSGHDVVVPRHGREGPRSARCPSRSTCRSIPDISVLYVPASRIKVAGPPKSEKSMTPSSRVRPRARVRNLRKSTSRQKKPIRSATTGIRLCLRSRP